MVEKVNLLKLTKAYIELERLSEQKLPLKISYQINKLMGRITRPYQFYATKEFELLDKYKPEKQEGNQVAFSTPEAYNQYSAEHDELDALEEEVDIEPIRIESDSDIKISASGIHVLMDVGMLEVIEKEDCHGTDCHHG